ncbi:MAG: alkaline phosphatase family protein [Bacteroidales bacterium]|nr:alkaline phosphatase family protein [Bacteroidales bacterium]
MAVKKILLTGLLLLFVRPGFPQPTATVPATDDAGRPRLVLSIVVEQMRTDYMGRFGHLMGDNGFKWMMRQGLSATKAVYNYHFTQAAPAYATLFTGTTPAIHGIVADSWYSPDLKAMTEATADGHTFPTGGSYARGQHSPRYLQASTLGDAIKIGTSMRGKVFGISLQPDGAILPAGFMADGAFWFDTVRGLWMTSSFYMDQLPAWIQELNAQKPGDRAISTKWTPQWLLPQYTGLADDNAWETGFNGQHTFPYDPKPLNAKIYTDDYQIVTAVPEGNTITKELAIKLIESEQLGQDDAVDFLSVSFAATGPIGSLFGPFSIETADAFVRLDRDIAELLSYLDRTIGLANVLVVFSSTGGCADPPAYMSSLRMNVGNFNANSAISLLTSFLHVTYGNRNWISGYYRQQLYFDQALLEAEKIPEDEILARSAGFLSDISGVSCVLTAQDLMRNSYTAGVAQKIQQGFCRQRSGDIVFSLLPGWTEKDALTTSGNSSYAYDAAVPLVFCGWNIPFGVLPGETDITAVTPSILHALHFAPANGSTGVPFALK